jgi:hypothetical protein
LGFSHAAEGAEKGFVLARDVTGKVHGDLPDFVPRNWTREQLEVSRDELQASIATRTAEQARLGEEAGHRVRIGQEESLLRSIMKRLDDL